VHEAAQQAKICPGLLWLRVQFGKDFADAKYDWKQDGRQQLLLPSEYKKAVAAKAPAPVISWHPKIISTCWKIACRCPLSLP
jgi:hypothetical protein